MWACFFIVISVGCSHCSFLPLIYHHAYLLLVFLIIFNVAALYNAFLNAMPNPSGRMTSLQLLNTFPSFLPSGVCSFHCNLRMPCVVLTRVSLKAWNTSPYFRKFIHLFSLHAEFSDCCRFRDMLNQDWIGWWHIKTDKSIFNHYYIQIHCKV